LVFVLSIKSLYLNLIFIQASGAGLDCAKKLLEQRKHQIAKEYNQSCLDAHETVTSSTLKVVPQPSHGKKGRESWVRSAAQAALSIRVHALLQATGHHSASVKLQHASLPFMASSKCRHDDDDELNRGSPPSGFRLANVGSEFESGVICVESELDVDEWGDVEQVSGYDLLPSPLHPSERSALCAGKTKHPSTVSIQDDCGFLYGEFECSKNPDDSSLSCPPTLGDVSVDGDIDKLRDIIYDLRNDLEKCLASFMVYDKALRRRMDLHLRTLTILDSWEGLRGLIISQKALLNSESSFNVNLESYAAVADKILQGMFENFNSKY
jgi:hypothetical protein